MTDDKPRLRRPDRFLLTVSGTIPADLRQQIGRGERPRADYLEIARALGEQHVDVVDVDEALRRNGALGKVLHKLGGAPLLLAWTCFRERGRYDVVITDGEQVGLPLAALCRLTLRRSFAHVMIGHILSVPKKRALFRTLRLGRYIDTMVLYATRQVEYVTTELSFPIEKVRLSTFMVDTAFFRPDAVEAAPGERPMICSAGLELRDYPTFMEAVRGLDARVVIAAASPWSKRPDATEGADLPANVERTRLALGPLRQLYADAAFVVMPLQETEFQAGVTSLLEAMAMGRAVVCSRTRGQTDVVVDGETGVYVRPGDAAELRAAIDKLLADPTEAARLGANGREAVVRDADIEVYAQRMARYARAAAARYVRWEG